MQYEVSIPKMPTQPSGRCWGQCITISSFQGSRVTPKLSGQISEMLTYSGVIVCICAFSENRVLHFDRKLVIVKRMHPLGPTCEVIMNLDFT
jgi:hypothetical protein